MGRKSKEQLEKERQQKINGNPKLKFVMGDKISLKQFMSYYGYKNLSEEGFELLYKSMENRKVPELSDLSELMSKCGYSCHALTLKALSTGLKNWNKNRKVYKEPIPMNGGVSIVVKEQPKVETVVITTNTLESDPITEVKVEEPVMTEVKTKKKRGRKSKAEKEAMRLAAEAEARKLAGETSDDYQ